MKSTLSLLLLFLTLNLYAQREELHFKGHTYFVSQIDVSDEYTKTRADFYLKGTSLKESIKSHTMLYKNGDDNSIELELGKYVVTDSCIIFYSFWCRYGDAPTSPFGARKQVYIVDKNGRFVLKESQLYIEKCAIDWAEKERDGCNGVQFLLEQAKTEKEKQLLQQYISKVEKEYEAVFVQGKQADTLLNETRTVLKQEIDQYTSYWDEYKNGFGYKK